LDLIKTRIKILQWRRRNWNGIIRRETSHE